ncbi:DUF3618 domain-containing protein [Sphingomonas gilva]|uniref:DUF3618 domain-containing protein n=1 Tax=Sphingomonas gilva TaxID=2305907 RepID=A0A396RM19_9SPHN|nr:DUF3618 domain-containing protein [Sphingomonas gilva]RHW17299.1 DUF3618 domain-containing protein [Sphingomonas gilva]
MNTPPSDSLARATARSIAARQQLADTLVDLQSRLSPDRLLRDGLDELRDAAADMGRDAIDQVRSRPGQAIAVAVAIVMFLARDRIADLVSSAGRKAVKPLRRRRVTPRTVANPRKDRP